MSTTTRHRATGRCLGFLLALPLLLTGCGESPEQAAYWTYEVQNRDGQAVLDTEAFDLVFDGLQVQEPQTGQFQVGGPGTSSGAIPVGPDMAFQYQYANETLTATLGDHTLRIVDGGARLALDGNTYTLGEEPVLIVRQDGTIDYRGD